MNLVLNNLQRLICHKIQQPTNQPNETMLNEQGPLISVRKEVIY